MATMAPGNRSSIVSVTTQVAHRPRAHVKIDGKCVCLPQCSLRYANLNLKQIAYEGGPYDIPGGEERESLRVGGKVCSKGCKLSNLELFL
jgi:hypothetical protein